MPLPFVLGILLTSMFLQRFGLPLGHQYLSVETPIGLALAAGGLLTGSLAIDRRRFALLLAVAALGLFTAVIGSNIRIAIAPPPSFASLVNWLAITAFAALTFRVAVPEEKLFRLVNVLLAVIALAGVLQFAAQFAGLPLFRFEGFVPRAFLLERFYNTSNSIFHYTAGQKGGAGPDVMRSNGFFLLEPPVFSQFMAFAIVIEMLYFRRTAFLALYLAGLLVSVSGTGWLMLIVFVAAQMMSGSRSRLATGLGLVAAATVAVVIFALLVPEAGQVLLVRINELQNPGHQRERPVRRSVPGAARRAEPGTLGSPDRTRPWFFRASFGALQLLHEQPREGAGGIRAY